MQFNTENPIVKLCAEGMNLEGQGLKTEAAILFNRAWDEAKTFTEKYIAAHYVARHQSNVEDKLKWDQLALDAAFQVKEVDVSEVLPSLFLNIAKCYEDLGDLPSAQKHYNLALSYCPSLPDDGYSKMIKSGIEAGLKRVLES